MIPGTNFSVRGRIDRVEIAAGDRAVRITDYKTGSSPPNAKQVVLGGGAELQRVLYGIAARQHLPDAAVHADLVYLGDAAPKRFGIPDPDTAMANAARMLTAISELVRRGVSLPGKDGDQQWNPYRIARPAASEPTLKKAAIEMALRDVAWIWNAA
jgi:RecB family exonuclease